MTKTKLSNDEMITLRDRLLSEIDFQKGIIQYGDADAADAAIARMPGLLKELAEVRRQIREPVSLLDYAIAIAKCW